MRVLAIDDEPGVLEFYRATLGSMGVDFESAADAARGLESVRTLSPDLVLLDYWLPDMNGLEVLRRIKALDTRPQVALVTGNQSVEAAVAAIREGAADYLCKPVTVEKLRSLVEQAKGLASQRERSAALEKELTQLFSLEGIVGRSPPILEVFDLVRRVAPHFRTALVLGETGTGKELVAQALHKLSPRRNQRFAVFNCAAVVETLAESQLFGHRKGAFTDAHEDKVGLFEWADGGTVFLDEVGDLTLSLQAKLLRVLENGEVQKLGSPQPKQVDVSVIAATSRDLNQAMQSGKFRADLWFRLNMIEIRLPRLRDRREDIPLIARAFLEHYNKHYGKEIRGISRRAQTALLAYAWPGNVRELENVIGRASMLARSSFLDLDDFPESIRGTSSTGLAPLTTLEEAEKAAIVRALAETPDKTLAARTLGVSRSTLYRLMKNYGLHPAQARAPATEKAGV